MSYPAVCTAPESSEIEARRRKIQTTMQADGLDALVLLAPDNVYYLTNFANMIHERPFVLVMPARGDPVFVLPRLEASHVKARSMGALEFSPGQSGWGSNIPVRCFWSMFWLGGMKSQRLSKTCAP